MPAPTSTARIAGNTEQTMTYDEFIAQAPRYEPPTDFDAWLKEAERHAVGE